MSEALWIGLGIIAGAGWGLGAGYYIGQRNAARAPVEELSRLKLDVSEALEKTSHLLDRQRKRQAPDGQAPQSQPVASLSKEDLRRRARELGRL